MTIMRLGMQLGMRMGFAGAAALALMLVSSTTMAREIPADGLTLGDVAMWLQAKGYHAEILVGSDGKQHVTSESEGVKFAIYMFDCKNTHCGSMMFSGRFATHGKFDTARMNEWNRSARWARGFFDSAGDPWVEYDVDLAPGGTYELLDDEFSTWLITLGRFVKQNGLE